MIWQGTRRLAPENRRSAYIMEFTQFDYKKEHVGFRACHNHIGKRQEYTIRRKYEGGRFDIASEDLGLCEECYENLPKIDPMQGISETKNAFRELILFLRLPGNEDQDYEQRQLTAYKKRLKLLREYAEQSRAGDAQ